MEKTNIEWTDETGVPSMEPVFKGNQLIIMPGDALEKLKTLQPDSIDCCITSPPYFGLRDYGVKGQIGLEANPELYISKLVLVFNEVLRVLKAQGTLWLSLGDSYEDKSLVGIPWKVAEALKKIGWILRSEIIWDKPNAMPESVKDRPTKSHETIFLFSKSKKYYFNADAIREPLKTKSNVREKCKEKHNHAVLSPIGKGIREWNNPLGRNKRTVWSISTKPFSGSHFATFPPEVVKTCISAGCQPRGTVLDPFLGSGTTLMVADQNDRSGIGIELNPEYVQIAKTRIKEGAKMRNENDKKEVTNLRILMEAKHGEN